MALDLSIVVDLDPTLTVTWKGKLLGGSSTKGGVIEILELDRESDLEFVERDIKKLDINGIPSIDFSEKVNQLLVKDMALTYLTVQPWSTNFDPAKPYLSLVKFWIRLRSLPGHLYNWKILLEIGELVGKVVRLDFNTDNKARGRFARMAVFVNLNKPLIFQILINGILQRTESLLVGEQSAGVRIRESNATMESIDRESQKLGDRSSGSHFKVLSIEIKGNGENEGAGEKLKGQRIKDLDEEISGIINKGRKVGLELGSNGFLDKGKNGGIVRPKGSLFGGRVYNSVKGVGSSSPAMTQKENKDFLDGMDSDGLNNLEKAHLNLGQGVKFSHYNPTFEGPIEMEVGVKDGLIDLRKHIAVVFKENQYSILVVSIA
ncbi:hypothetical protein Gorai_019155, partial [Gossypium raimondii]|nr:hypothetical protein [Gossypium raimondii]